MVFFGAAFFGAAFLADFFGGIVLGAGRSLKPAVVSLQRGGVFVKSVGACEHSEIKGGCPLRIDLLSGSI